MIDRDRELALESALCDAALMATVTVEFIGRALRFDRRDTPPLSYEEQEMLSFVVLQTRMHVDKAKAIFFQEDTP